MNNLKKVKDDKIGQIEGKMYKMICDLVTEILECCQGSQGIRVQKGMDLAVSAVKQIFKEDIEITLVEDREKTQEYVVTLGEIKLMGFEIASITRDEALDFMLDKINFDDIPEEAKVELNNILEKLGRKMKKD